jgi:NAD(P)-dependent dehydrogenase (short-subunit alcohol dehydrogenase family)
MAKRTAIITGAGQGMGREMALLFASHGVRVILVGKTLSKLEAVAGQIRERGEEAVIQHIDVTDRSAVDGLADQLAGETIDMLLNCAGDWLIQPAAQTTDEQLDHILAVNLIAPIRLCRALLPHLRKSDNATIINIGTLAAVNSYAGISAYTASKTGLRGFTGSLAEELRPESIRVVMISPSPTNTPMRWAATPDANPEALIDPVTIAETAWMIVNLPRSITTGDVVLKSMLTDM